MKFNFETALTQVVKESIKNNDFKGYLEDSLSNDEITLLHKKIELLPNEATELILGKYYFGFTSQNMKTFYNIEDADSKLSYYERILSYSMGLENSHRISSSSMTKASREIVNEMVTSSIRVEKAEPVSKVHSLKKTLKIVLIAAIIMALSITSVIAFNKDFRERVVSWVVEKHQDYSRFSLETENKKDYIEPITEELMLEYIPEYIPEGMILKEQVTCGTVSYTYASDNETLDIILSKPDEFTYMDTENQEVKEIQVNRKKAFWFGDINEGSICCIKDGIFISVHGNLSKKELIKIAENINRKK